MSSFINNPELLISSFYTTSDLPSLNTTPSFQRRTETQAKKIPIDVINDSDNLIIYAELPGINEDSIQVDFYNNKLTITADKLKPYESSDVNEIKYGTFKRNMVLPICVTKKETVSIQFKNGVLRILISKNIEEENKFSMKLNSN